MFETVSTKLTSLAVALIFVLVGSVQIATGMDEDHKEIRTENGEPEIPTRIEEEGTTLFKPDLSNFLYVPFEENLVQREEGYIKLDDRIASGTKVVQASKDSTYHMSTSRMAQSYKGTLYICFLTTETSGGGTLFFNMMTSDDEGETWNGPVVVGHKNGTMTGSLDLKIHHDKIFFLMTTGAGMARELSVKVCHYLNWKNLSGVPKHTIENIAITQTSLVEFQGSMMIFWKRATSGRPYYQTYNNGSWSSTEFINIDTARFAPIFSDMNGLDTVYLYYVSGSGDNEVHVMNTTNIGQTWSPGVKIMSLSGQIEHISTARGNEKVHMAVSYNSIDQISYFHHTPGGTGAVTKVTDYVPNIQDSDPREVTISCVGEDIYIMHEGLGGKVTLTTIRDGPYPVEREIFGSGMGHSPAMSPDMTAICFMNGTDLEIRTMGEAKNGRMFLYPISPIGLSSWDDLGFFTGGMTDDSYISYNILDLSDGTQLFPTSGTGDLRLLDPGWIEGEYYSNMIDVLGDWTSGEGMVPSIIMEVLFHRVEGDDPWLMEVCVNYTNSFPYRDELEEDLHISASMNCDITPIGLEMNEGADDAWAILGPIEFEGSRPEHLSVLGSFLGGKNRISAEVLDTEWEIIPGFELSRSTVVTEEDVQSFIKWEDLNLYDLPLTLDMIYIRLRMEKETSVEPAIKWVELGGSTDPSIIGSSIDRAWINRGENTIIGIEVADLEDPSEGLSVELEYTAPGSDTWESALLTEGLWVEGMWSFDIFTGMETVKGEYTFRARATDGVGMVSDWTDLEISLEVRNNLPDAPMICVEPGVARVGDDIEISTIWEGEDLERSSGELTYTLVLYNDGVEHSSYDNITTPDMIIEGLTFEKHQNWTITVTTWDGENTSEPFVTWFLVENTEPVTTGQLPGSLTMLEDTPLLLDDVGSWFFDADGDALDHSFETIEEIEISIDDDGVLLTPMTDHHGEGYLLIDLWDDEIVLSVNISLTIRSVNDAPLYNDISTVKVMQDKWTYVDIGSRDPSDGEVLLFSSDITDIIPGAVEGENLFFYPNGSFRLKTDNDMVGTHNITYRIEDEEHTIIDHVQIEVIDVNDAPSIISADTLNSNTVYLAGENIALLASASDPDEQWGEKLRYEWTSSIVGPIGNGNELTVTLQEGIHIITLEVFDDRGAMNSTSFSIIVLAEEKEQGEVMRTSTLYLIAGGGAFVLGLIIALLLIVLSVMKRKKDRAAEKKEEEKEEEKEEVKKAPALTPDPKDQLKPGLKPGAPENRQLPPAVSQPENVVPRINGTRGQEPARAPVSQPVSPSPGPSGPSPESVKTEPGPTPSQMPQQSTPEQTIPETQPQTANLTQQVPPIQKQNLVPQPSNAPQGFTAQPKIEDPSSEGGK